MNGFGTCQWKWVLGRKHCARMFKSSARRRGSAASAGGWRPSRAPGSRPCRPAIRVRESRQCQPAGSATNVLNCPVGGTLKDRNRRLKGHSPDVAGVRSDSSTPEAHAPRAEAQHSQTYMCMHLAPVLAEPALRVHGGHGTRARRRDRLAVDGIRHIPSGIDAGDGCYRRAR